MYQDDATERDLIQVCNDNGSTNRVECRCRPCPYAIVKGTSEEEFFCWSNPAWRVVVASVGVRRQTTSGGAVGRDQDTADLDTPDRIYYSIAVALPRITKYESKTVGGTRA
jgi:hypothetical protein